MIDSTELLDQVDKKQVIREEVVSSDQIESMHEKAEEVYLTEALQKIYIYNRREGADRGVRAPFLEEAVEELRWKSKLIEDMRADALLGQPIKTVKSGSESYFYVPDEPPAPKEDE